MAITIYRRWAADSDENSHVDSMNVTDFANQVEAGLNGFRPDYVEGYNETHHRGDDLLRYIDWTAKYVIEMHRRGYKVAAFSFATGNPGLPFPGDPNPMDVENLVLDDWAGADAVVWHCYWGNQGFTRYHALRWLAAHIAYPHHPPFIIGETGRDAVESGQSGWKASGVTMGQYVAELQAYATILSTHPFVLGATPFSSAPSWDWASFDCEGLPLAGLPKLGPHCILDPSGYDTDWIRSAPIVKQIDKTSALQQAGAAGMDEAIQTAMIQMEARQGALMADYIKAEAEGRWTGPGSVDGIYCAMKGGLAAPDYTRVYPPQS